MRSLLHYLYGPGRFREHRDPRIIAGFDDPAALEPGLRADGRRDFDRLSGLLTQPMALLGDRNHERPVWHVPVRAAPEDPVLSDVQWARIAVEVMDRSGLAPAGDPDAVRWIAVRHADDHVHIVATLARQDGVRPEVWNDAYRLRDACRAIERRYGLRSTAPADRTAARRTKRGEAEKAARSGHDEPSRARLRRHVQTAAAAAWTEADFFARLENDGVLVHRRLGRHGSDQATGYAVALPDDRNAAGRPVWFGGGKLAADLTLPRLRQRWSPAAGPVSGRDLSERTVRAYLRMAVRQAADRSRTADSFFAQLERTGVLLQVRHGVRDPSRVTGYVVTVPDHFGPRWYGGAELAADLSWEALSHRWRTGQSPTGGTEPSAEERRAIYEDAAKAAALATAEVRRHAVTAPHRAHDACWAAADTLRSAAMVTGNRHLHRAADAYDRAARAPYGRIPAPTPAGNRLRTAARLLAITGSGKDTALQVFTALVVALMTLTDAIADLHHTQRRPDQERAARSAAARLARASSERPTAPRHADQPPVPRPTNLAMTDFPRPWAPSTRPGVTRAGVRKDPRKKGPTP
ncbi:relaxase/mobilization nuclease domain-containing protein [Spirillospora sp. NPDC050679]